MADWLSRLRQSSFRGVPFAVEAGERQVGRRQALHEYPDRDDGWAEDMGRATRRIRLRGFLVEASAVYGGGDVLAQARRLEAAAEAAGPGLLVHPTKGSMTVSCQQLSLTERWDLGRVVQIEFSFLQTGERLFPQITGLAGGAIATAVQLADAAIAGDLAGAIGGAIGLGGSVIAAATGAGSDFADAAVELGADATSVFNLVSELQGDFGRYFNGGNVGAFASRALSVADSLGDLIPGGAAKRASIADAGDRLETAAAGVGGASGTAAVAAAALDVAGAVRASARDPRDAIRLLSSLAGVFS